MSIVAANDPRSQNGQLTHEVAVDSAGSAAAQPASPFLVSKWLTDLVLSLGLLVVTAPVVMLAMIAIKLTSRGPALYSQTRLGRSGKPFVIYKLRTMQNKCESLTGAKWCTPDDPRITWLGRILRKTHIDELPQLWNVIKGDMSLVGPRPERPEFVPVLEQAIPRYRERLLMKPGVTGFAQVQLPPDTNLASVRIKLAYDLYYVKHASLWLDFRILLCTGAKLVGLSFGTLRVLHGLPRRETVEMHYDKLTALACAPQEREGAATGVRRVSADA